ncbi:MAG: TM0106 family RecB-like putative nuclease [Ornithinimicrobium sp.]
MQMRDGSLVLSATDVTKHAACPHVTTLDHAAALGQIARPDVGVDEQLQLIFSKGLEHERAYLQSLYARGLEVVEIPEDGLSPTEREHLTMAAMRSGAEVIFQAALYDGAWVGYADFMLRVERPGRLGPWSYDIADTKLARRLKVPALLQMATYAVRLEELQGVPPAQLTVVAGDDKHYPWRLVDVAAYARLAREHLSDAVDQRPKTEPVPVAYCGQCRWEPRCSAQWRADDDLCLVAGMRSDQRLRLREAGIATGTELANVGPGDPRVQAALSSATRDRLCTQAALQLGELTTGSPDYRLLPPASDRGFSLLPEPNDADVYLDFEGDPFAPGGQGLEYLAGVCDRTGEFYSWWAHDAQAEAQLVADLLTWLCNRWKANPGMHIYHYASYEQAALKRLTQRESIAESELDMLLRGERFVDLYAVVRQSVQISKPSYSIKQLEAFYWGHTRTSSAGGVDNALSSVVQYEKWASSDQSDTAILDRIAEYNRDDVHSTLALHGWLEERRAEAIGHSGVPVPRPEHKPPLEASDSELIQRESELSARLDDAENALLAACIGWHRREDKHMWWEYYRTATMSEEELIEDRLTLGGCAPPVRTGVIRRSEVWRYTFPAQEARIGKNMHDAATHEAVGPVHDYDLEEGWIEITRGQGREPLTALAMVAKDGVPTKVLREALIRLGTDVLNGADCAGGRLLQRAVPAGLPSQDAEDVPARVCRLGRGLRGEVLAVQGPPGSGKTYAGVHLIRELLDSGLRVGVTAPSHAVLDALLRKTGRPATRKVSKEMLEQRPAERSIEKDQIDDFDVGPADDPVTLSASTSDLRKALDSGACRLVGGTAWLWAEESMSDAVDVLVIDEAGQFSLANALAVSSATTSLVLLGDPQQLAAPSNAVHPDGAGVSVLEHMSGGAAVIDANRGVFLDRTWRMHPAIARFVSTMSYDGQLESAPGRDRQRVVALDRGNDSGLSGAGLRWRAVQHEGFSSENPVEAQLVGGVVARLLGGRWMNEQGTEREIRPQDVLVVTPYNAHVAAVTAVVPDGVRVGTVDKFQGREAAVVIYSMASSSAADAPRGVDFLYDTHRLNVAISRAKALAIIVGSPQLLRAPADNPEQLRAVNALCRFVEVAEPCS